MNIKEFLKCHVCIFIGYTFSSVGNITDSTVSNVNTSRVNNLHIPGIKVKLIPKGEVQPR